MLILALDLARVTGFAVGAAGSVPKSGSWSLRQQGEDMRFEPPALVLNIIRLLDGRRPDVIVVEEALEAAAKWKGGHAMSWSLKSQHRLHGALEAFAGVSRIRKVDVASNTVRKFCCGRASAGGRVETKAMVRDAMVSAGLVPAGTKDTDRTDAVAVWRWAEDAVAGVSSLTLMPT
jgi:hypothetical protein